MTITKSLNNTFTYCITHTNRESRVCLLGVGK